MHDNTSEKISFCKKVESNTLSSTIDNTDKKGIKSSKVSSCEQTEVMPCRLRLTMLIKKGVKVQRSDLSSKYERSLQY